MNGQFMPFSRYNLVDRMDRAGDYMTLLGD
jgi:hypothetical protein